MNPAADRTLKDELAAVADPRHGQHFLVSESKLADIVDAAAILRTDHVLELGAGAGTVARALPPSASLTLVELDESLGQFLHRNVPHARIVHGDAIELVREFPCDILLSNLPHQVTERLLPRPARTPVPYCGPSPIGNPAALGTLTPTYEWREFGVITGDDFVPPQQAISHLVRVIRKR